ncbi:PLP-dependent aminotransferase family protein [Salinisphaera sp.]|uniref:aminotransferase-like domain-containing protein n=1 Tax=Salinisphaera sp. TaxID=1914330 RepID=UPI002D78D971|nr:PLP-dependent aminotransferase family protein [Salinisphaera sp.]HET7313576.1 PLP-dependent aminotransferase family protein [Salinisphaera sp.]
MTIWVPQLSGDGPRYRQLATAIGHAIESSELAPGTRLPPQRRLAHALGVTVGTITRGYGEAERRGWVEARVGSGTYVRAGSRRPAFSHVSATRDDDGVTDLSLALPPADTERDAALARALAGIQGDPRALAHALDYQPEGGLDAHREIYARWMTDLGLPVDAGELIIDQGGMNGIFLALSALGGRVAAERLSYPGVISVAGQLGLRLVGLDHDADGLAVDALAARHDQQPFDVLYVMPEHQNPTTARLDEARRRALVDFARERDVWIVEDGVQHLASAERGTPLYRLAPERTVYLFSVSKILAGGLRSGAMRVPPGLRERVATVVRNVSWMPPPLIAAVVGQWIASGDADRQLARQFDELEARRRMVEDALAEFSPCTRAGGFYAWLALPPGQRASRVVERLAEARIRVNPAEAFCVGSEAAPQAIRLCFSAARDRAALADALVRIREVLAAPAPSAWQTI